jgi:hypothetical protein
MGQVTVEVPGEAVERAAEQVRPAGLLLQDAATVEADVVERLDGVGRGPHHQDRQVGDVVREVVADLGDVLLTACHLPDALPELLHLEAMELRRRELGHRHEVRPRLHPRLPPQHVGHSPTVRVEQLLVAEASRAGREVGRGHQDSCPS